MALLGLARWHRRILMVAGVLAGLLVVGAGLAWYFLDDLIEARLRPATIRLLSERFGGDVDIREMRVRVLPKLAVHVGGVSLRHQGRTDVPPLISIQSMTLTASVWRLRQSHIDRLHVVGLEIVIPPKPAAVAAPVDEPKRGPLRLATAGFAQADAGGSGLPDAFIEELLSENAKLTILPKRDDKPPREFLLHRIKLTDMRFSQPMPFEATVTNPVPEGRIETVGTLGPWSGDDPGLTPLGGTFTFDADLGTIKGIGGALDAEGSYTGVLERIEASGRTSTPDFRITALDANALPLETTFKTIVDGTSGDVALERVEATLADSTFVTSGTIAGRKGVRGRFIQLDIHGEPARLDDVLRLAMKGEQPAMVGGLTIDARMDLPPGEADVVERMTLEGRFHIDRARFTNDAVQGKIDELARRGSGRPKDDAIDNVMSDMRGDFTLGDGRLRLRNLTFRTQGAAIAMAGHYGLKDERLDFRGDVRLQARASQMVTGVGSVLLKPFDPLLRKRGAGTRVAIKVTGSRAKPSFGVELGRTLRGR